MRGYATATVLFLMAGTTACAQVFNCGASQEPAAVVHAQVEAYNKHDVPTFLSCYADTATIHYLDGHPAVEGMEGLRKMYAFLSRIPPQGVGYGVDILNTTVTGPTVANVEHLRGLPPGAPPKPDTLVVYEVRDGKILNVWFAPDK
jgi:hypothetical protein